MSQVRILSSRSYSSSEDVSLYFYESLTTISCKLRLYSGENLVGSLLFDIQSDEDSSFKIVKVPKAESVALDDFDEVVSSF